MGDPLRLATMATSLPFGAQPCRKEGVFSVTCLGSPPDSGSVYTNDPGVPSGLPLLMPEESVRNLEMQGFDFYRWPLHAAESGVTIRLVTCFATLSADVDEFITAAAAIKTRG